MGLNKTSLQINIENFETEFHVACKYDIRNVFSKKNHYFSHSMSILARLIKIKKISECAKSLIFFVGLRLRFQRILSSLMSDSSSLRNYSWRTGGKKA